MKRGTVILVVLLLFLLLVSPLAISKDNNETEEGNLEIDDSDTETAKVNKAYICLKDKTIDCEDLSLEEKIFTLLAIGKCGKEILDEAKGDGDCWPKSDCQIKMTAQAILALDRSGTSTLEAEEWLLKQNSTPSEFEWFLQVESTEEAICEIEGHAVTVQSNKKLSSGAGSCLTLSSGDYWLKISPSCYNKEFSITCDKSFATNLLYKRPSSDVIHVSGQTNSASAEGTTKEKIKLQCFKQQGVCDYVGTLWVSYVLDSLDDYDVSSFTSYLSALSDDEPVQKYLPEAFLFGITKRQEYKDSLLLKQKENYWDESGEKVYDTAIALLPLYYEDLIPKTKSKEWLLSIQDSLGCWKANIRNTAFALYAIWPREITPMENFDCVDQGYYCASSIKCQEAGGEQLQSYTCPVTSICCSKEPLPKTCQEQDGEICNQNEECSDGNSVSTADLDTGQICCVGGTCSPKVQESECVRYSGDCRDSCNDNEEEVNYECDNFGEICCKEKQEQEKSYLWLWILIILIILVVSGIVFRNKLRPFWFKIKSKFKKTPPRPPRMRNRPTRMPQGRPRLNAFQRTIQRNVVRPAKQIPKSPLRTKPQGELRDVLNKLKKMGK